MSTFEMKFQIFTKEKEEAWKVEAEKIRNRFIKKDLITDILRIINKITSRHL